MQQDRAQVELHACQSWLHVWSNVYVYTSESIWNPNSTSLKCGKLQHDCLLHMLSLNSILPAPLSHCALMPAEKNLACYKNVILFYTHARTRARARARAHTHTHTHTHTRVAFIQPLPSPPTFYNFLRATQRLYDIDRPQGAINYKLPLLCNFLRWLLIPLSNVLFQIYHEIAKTLLL